MSYTTFPEIDGIIADTEPVGDVVADFATTASDRPQRAAIVHNGSVITFRELAERVRLTAAHYRVRGFGADRPFCQVGVLVSHTPAVVEHLLGILQARATYCPIDATLPVARKQALAAALGVDRLFAADPGRQETTNLWMDTLGDDPVAADTELPQPLWHRDDSAYVLCTSGSTGTPKPVVVSRQALTVTVRALRDLFALTPEDRVLQFASLGWDTCLEEILPALTAGAALVFDDAAHSGHSRPSCACWRNRKSPYSTCRRRFGTNSSFSCTRSTPGCRAVSGWW